MKKKILFTLALAILLAVPLSSAFAVESFVQPAGVLQYNADKSYGGYQLFAGTGTGNLNSYLIDMEGFVVNEWKTNYVPGLHDILTVEGNLLRAQKPWASEAAMPAQLRGQGLKLSKQKYNGAPLNVGGGHGGLLQEFDWNGNLVWEYELNDATHVQHHTFARHPVTGNTLILGWEYKSQAECIAKGRNPATVNDRGLWPDYLIEVNKNNEIVWEFHVWDNLVQNFDPSKPNYGNPKDNQDKWDINWISPGANTATTWQDWTHFNTATYDLGNSNRIVTNSRHMGESYIIDKAAKRLVWRFGNPSVYGGGVAPSFQSDGDQLLFGPHNAYIIAPGLPGAGNMLILDNGWNRPAGNRTRTIEVDLTRTSGAGGNTTGTLHPGYIVWQFFGSRANSAYSASQCSNQRLPNGNTLITITETGHIIEVTKGVASGANWINKDVVWEFINPLESSTDTATGIVTYPVVRCLFRDVSDTGTHNPTSIHRSERYGTDFAGLRGKELSRKYHVAQGCPQFWQMLDSANLTWTPGVGYPASRPTGFGFGPIGGGGGGGGGTGGSGGGGGGY